MLFSEHMNWSLKDNGSPDLRGLRADTAFSNDLETRLKNPHFIAGVLRQDLANHDHTYTTYLLFAYDYVHLGPGFTPHLDGAFAAAPSGQLVAEWVPSLLQDVDQSTSATIMHNLTKATTLMHAVTNEAGQVAPVATTSHFKSLQTINIISQEIADALSDPLSKLDSNDAGVWKSIAEQNKTLWDNTEGKWASAVASVAQRSTKSTVKSASDGERFGEGFLAGLTFGLEQHEKWRETTTTGQEVADWINNGKSLRPEFVILG